MRLISLRYIDRSEQKQTVYINSQHVVSVHDYTDENGDSIFSIMGISGFEIISGFGDIHQVAEALGFAIGSVKEI